jgi:hypothetical protein
MELKSEIKPAFAKQASESNNFEVKEAIPITGRGGPWGSETSRFPHF